MGRTLAAGPTRRRGGRPERRHFIIGSIALCVTAISLTACTDDEPETPTALDVAFYNDAARFDLSDPSFLVFADEDGETANGYISQFHFSDRAYSTTEIGALGGANAAAIPEPSGLLLSAGAALGLLTRRRRA